MHAWIVVLQWSTQPFYELMETWRRYPTCGYDKGREQAFKMSKLYNMSSTELIQNSEM